MTKADEPWRCYRVRNTARGTILADRAEQASTFFHRLRGLMGHAPLQAGEGLHIVPCNGIHTFFMRGAIDALFLDREGRIVRRYKALSPWRATGIYPGVHSVLELPPGMVEATNTNPGDTLSFERVG